MSETLRSAVLYNQTCIVLQFEQRLKRSLTAAEAAPIRSESSLVLLGAMARDIDDCDGVAQVEAYLAMLAETLATSKRQPLLPPPPTFWHKVGTLLVEIFQ